MNLLDAHAAFTTIHPNELFDALPDDISLSNDAPRTALECLLPAVCAGAASLSGMLEDCNTIPDLKDALAHFGTLWNSEIVEPRDLDRAMAEVFGLLDHIFGKLMPPQRQFTQAEMN